MLKGVVICATTGIMNVHIMVQVLCAGVGVMLVGRPKPYQLPQICLLVSVVNNLC